MKKFIKNIFILLISSTLLTNCAIEKQENSYIKLENFKRKGYTQEEIELFNDIAFSKGCVRKWDKEIRVEVIGTPGPNAANIDSVIKIIEPLIAPVKIKRVKTNGNLIVYRGVSKNQYKGFLGFATYNSSAHTKKIQNGIIYEMENAKYLTLMHEFEHVLGLNHPQKAYPFGLLIWGQDSPGKASDNYNVEKHSPLELEPGHYHFKSFEDFARYQEEQKQHVQVFTEMLTEQEKQVIRMLYSPDIKAGLKRSTFMRLMNINDDIHIWDEK